MKAGYARPRPPDPLFMTTGYSFPSGHAVAAVVTAVGIVIVLLPPGASRTRWEIRAIVFVLVMALSRVYLNAHWLSDVVEGVLIGTALALLFPSVLQSLRVRAQRGTRDTVRASEAIEETPPSPMPESAVNGHEHGPGPGQGAGASPHRSQGRAQLPQRHRAEGGPRRRYVPNRQRPAPPTAPISSVAAGRAR